MHAVINGVLQVQDQLAFTIHSQDWYGYKGYEHIQNSGSMALPTV
jgi:hypothetical protein